MFQFCKKFFGVFAYTSSILVFVLRYHWGMLFLNMGAGKLAAPSDPVAMFGQLNIPFPEFSVFLVGNVEYYAGLLLILGLLSRLAALSLTCVMVVAYFTAHYQAVLNSFPALDPTTWTLGPIAGEMPFPFLVMLLVVLIAGPGKISVDYILSALAQGFQKLRGK